MDEKEKQYLNKRLTELFNKKIQLNLEVRKIDKEIARISKRLEKEIITDE